MVRINQLELENVKRIKAVALAPSETGLTIIGGRNGQGKTSVLDAIAWALGGEKYRPSQAQRMGSVLPPHLKLTLSNGLTVERGGKNGALKVLDPSGRKGGQQILNEFVEQLALDLPKFLQASEKEKAEILLQVIGVGEQLTELDRQAAEIYNRRHAVGQIADQKEKFAKEKETVPEIAACVRERKQIRRLKRGSFPWTKTYIIRPLFNRYLVTDKYFRVDASRCISCGRCSKMCPVGDIIVDEIPQWQSHCTGCMACFHACPHHAINFGKMTQKKGQYNLMKQLYE